MNNTPYSIKEAARLEKAWQDATHELGMYRLLHMPAGCLVAVQTSTGRVDGRVGPVGDQLQCNHDEIRVQLIKTEQKITVPLHACSPRKTGVAGAREYWPTFAMHDVPGHFAGDPTVGSRPLFDHWGSLEGTCLATMPYGRVEDHLPKAESFAIHTGTSLEIHDFSPWGPETVAFVFRP